MSKYFLFLVLSFSIFTLAEDLISHANADSLVMQCEKDMLQFSGSVDKKLIKSACGKVIHIEDCNSSQGIPIYHYEKKAIERNAKKILVFSLIHGDEVPAGSLGRFWIQRLEEIDSRNQWRVIPVLNPDGFKLKTRTNANKVDLNRNFPTKDWEEKAISEWKNKTKSQPRRYPGAFAASEPETRCALKQIQDFQPDFVISIHTPLTVLDFDGPKLSPPKFESLPWKSLGHFPGSLGRYLWSERSTPVLTMELKAQVPNSFSSYEKLQDMIGGLVKTKITEKSKAFSAFTQREHE